MEAEDQDLYLAGKNKRLINFLADYIINVLLCRIIINIVILAQGEPGIKLTSTTIFIYSLAFGVQFFYYFLMEAVFGITIGKILTGTKVVDEWGNKPDFKTSFIRTIARFIPFEALSFLLLEIGWHDSFSGTRVVLSIPSSVQEES